MVFGLNLVPRGVDIADRRAGFKGFAWCVHVNSLFFLRVPRFCLLVKHTHVVLRAGSKVVQCL